MKEKRERCPECKSGQTVKNGNPTVWVGRRKCKVQLWRCKECGRQFRKPSIKEALKNA